MAHNPGFLKLVNEAKSRVKQTDIAGYKKMLADGEKAVLLDVREDNEWTAGHAAGAMHLGKGIIRIRKPSLCFIAVGDSDRSWPRTLCSRWGIRIALPAASHSEITRLAPRVPVSAGLCGYMISL